MNLIERLRVMAMMVAVCLTLEAAAVYAAVRVF